MQDNTLTDLERHFLDCMRGKGWLTRSQINIIVGRKAKYMTGSDVDRLNGLVKAGLVETRQTQETPIYKIYEYRVKDKS